MSETTQKKAATEINTVTMEDGKIVEFVGKRRMLKSSEIDAKGHVELRIDFINGRVVKFKLPQGLMAKFAAHGAEQKFGDETAGLKDIDDAVLAVENLAARLEEGKWSQERTSSGLAGSSVLHRALMEHTGKTSDQIRAFLDAKTQAEKMALRGHASIRPIIERLEAEKAKKGGINSDALLGELTGDDEATEGSGE